MSSSGHQWRWSDHAISGTCLLCGLIGAWRVKQSEEEPKEEGVAKSYFERVEVDGVWLSEWVEKEPECPGK